jgi:hypothetical protein
MPALRPSSVTSSTRDVLLDPSEMRATCMGEVRRFAEAGDMTFCLERAP